MATYQLPPQNNLYTDPDEEQVEAILRKGGFLIPDPPSYDPATHKEPRWNVAAQTADPENWIVEAYTSEELEAIAAEAALEANLALIRGKVPDLEAHLGTQEERLIRVENGLAKTLRHYAAKQGHPIEDA